jgi:molybdate transport system substrate-binding protein
MRARAIALVMLAMTVPAAAETVQLYAAGSLKAALTEVAKAFETKTGNEVEANYGASGVLRKEITDGAKADIFASANMEHPQALNDDGTSGPVALFARNRLCALVKPGLKVTTDNLLASMLDDKVKLATSTPRVDPSGDYALESFTKAEALKAGAQDRLERKARKLTGGKDSAAPPPGRTVYGWHVAEGRADIFLTYCTNALAAQKENPGQQIVELPDALSVGADYGLTVIDGAPVAAQEFVEFILSAEGQKILVSHGFAPGQI